MERLNNLKTLENFFRNNIILKNIISAIMPDTTMQYNERALIKYKDLVYDYLEKIEITLLKTCDSFGLIQAKKIIEKKFQNYLSIIDNCPYKYEEYVNIYTKIFSNMNLDLINMVNTSFKGYIINNEPFDQVLTNATSINEIIHVFHSYVINNENILQTTPLIDNTNDTLLYGNSTDIARKLYEAISTSLNDGSEKTIFSLNDNHILLMLRDYGHATTIDIEIENDKAYINYFIPKVCNYLMVNNLPGITKVNDKSLWAKGTMSIDVSKLPLFITSFIKMIPTDNEMFIEGGLCYEYNKGR